MENKVMKKQYIAPEAKEIKVNISGILAGSLDVDNDPNNGVSGDAKSVIFDYDWDEE